MPARRIAAAALAAVAVALLLGLGAWQVERLAWKRALIARVDARLAAPPVAAPGPDRWPRVGRDDAYARVAAAGRWRVRADTLVQAVTVLGPGHWVLTPLDVTSGKAGAGWTLLVNRGFVPADAAPAPPPAGPVRIAGLLRLTEPGGGFLRSNDARADRWHSRDVAAIAARRGLARAAPYFVDADGAGAAGRGGPRGGLTVVRFPNNHLAYALTWFALAGVVAVLAVRALRPGAGP